MSKTDSSDRLSWSVGALTVTRVEESILPLTAKVLVPDATVDQVEANRPWIDPYFDGEADGHPVLRLSIHSFVIEAGATTIVVDTCVGPDPERSLPGDPGFVHRLDTALGSTPAGGLAGVDVVVCTHVHFDHVGWNTRTIDGVVSPTFPNARYLVTRAEMDEVEADDHMAVREPSILPLADAGLLDVIDLDDGRHRICDGVELIATPGHTAGHVSVHLRSGDDEALITGDAFHTPLQFAHPDLAAWRFDTDAEQSTATRRRLVGRFAGTDALVLGTHFAPPTAGRLVRDGAAVRFEG
jgi:glyoxylase-like metal-dependent hydrolase (beta-lactamase superfamily II)